MLTLVLGLVLFNGLHLVPAAPGLRLRLRDRIEANGYLVAFSVVSQVKSVRT